MLKFIAIIRFFGFGKLNLEGTGFQGNGVSWRWLPMDFGFSGELIFIMILALILFGPRKLPEIARTMGRFMADFRKASADFQTQIQSEIRQLEMEEADPTKHLAPAVDEVKKMADEEETSISGALNRLSERIKGSIPQDYDA